jgi:hypothetical protein
VSCTPFSRQFFFFSTGSSGRVVRSLGKRTRPACAIPVRSGRDPWLSPGSKSRGPSATRNLLAGASAEDIYVVLFKIPRRNQAREWGDSTAPILMPTVRRLWCGLCITIRENASCASICHYQVSTQACIQFQSLEASISNIQVVEENGYWTNS